RPHRDGRVTPGASAARGAMSRRQHSVGAANRAVEDRDPRQPGDVAAQALKGPRVRLNGADASARMAAAEVQRCQADISETSRMVRGSPWDATPRQSESRAARPARPAARL